MQAYVLNDEQREIQALVWRLARDKVAARAAAIDRSAEYPQDMFDLLREVGLFTFPFPQEYGGTDSMLSAAVAVEELGRVCHNTADLLIVQWVPFGAILAAGSAEQKQRLLGPLAAGELRGASSTTEPQSGSDVAGIRTRARHRPGAGGHRPQHRVRAEPRHLGTQGQREPGHPVDVGRHGDADRGRAPAGVPLGGGGGGGGGGGASGIELAPIAAMAKCFASDTAMRVATDAVQLFGAAGISADTPINRYFRDAKVLQVIERTNQIQRNLIGGSLLGRAPR